MIFTLALLIFSKTIINATSSGEREIKELLGDAEQIGNIIMTEGQPLTWNVSTVEKIGLRTDKEINMNKLLEMQKIEYYKSKILFGVTGEYFIAFKKQDGNNIEINGTYGIGHANVNATQTQIRFDNLGVTDLTQLTRITRYGSDIIKVEVYTWH